MAFSKNNMENIRFDDPILHLTKKNQAYLERSWAGFFASEIFPKIDEDRFSPLYCGRQIGRYNNPVNQIVGCLLLKELFRLSDEQLAAETALDIRYKYAMHCTDKSGSILTAAALSRFRNRNSAYKRKTGTDLLLEEYRSLRKPLSDFIKKYKVTPRANTKLHRALLE